MRSHRIHSPLTFFQELANIMVKQETVVDYQHILNQRSSDSSHLLNFANTINRNIKPSCKIARGHTSFVGRLGSASTAFQTGSHVFIKSLNPKEDFKSKMRGAKPRQLVCRHVILAVSMSVSPAEMMAKSTRTLSS